MDVLVTGGAGYIGSTVASAAQDAGHRPIVLDDLSTGRREFAERHAFVEGDVGDPAALDEVFARFPDVAAVVHCAALVVVPDSTTDPLRYYDQNVGRSIDLVASLVRHGSPRIVFSSSAAVYAAGEDTWVDETSPTAPSSPYARTKLMMESVLADVAASSDLRALSLRYFNPIGADPRLRTGNQHERPDHVLGRIVQAHRSGTPFTITGTDYPTRDGTGLRDYVHVWDLAQAHVAAIERFDDVVAPGEHRVMNLGTGRGTTVRELVDAFVDVTGSDLRVELGPRRPGDVPGAAARIDLAVEQLGWCPERDLHDGIRTAVAWARRRPDVLG